MKKKHAILVITIGTLLLGFVPVVAANGRVTQRQLDDWLAPNYAAFPWGEENWAFADFYSPYSLLVAKMGLAWPKAGLPWTPWWENDVVYENSLVDGATIIEGSIKERVLKDGTALITLQLDVTNAPLTVYHFFEFLDYCFGDTDEVLPILGAGIDGYIDYKVVAKFIIPYPGAPLPHCFGIWDDFISVNIHGIGYGTMTERAVELGFATTVGATGMLLFHQLALFKPDFEEGHPKYYGDGEFWPVETVEIFEMS